MPPQRENWLGTHLYELILRSGISTQILADALNTSVDQIEAWRVDEERPPRDALLLIATLLGDDSDASVLLGAAGLGSITAADEARITEIKVDPSYQTIIRARKTYQAVSSLSWQGKDLATLETQLASIQALIQTQQGQAVGESPERILRSIEELVLQARQTAKRLTLPPASISQVRRQSVVVTDEDLLKLNSNFLAFGQEPLYEVESVDGISRRFSNVQELIGFENTPAKDIVKLRIKSDDAVISFENDALVGASPSNDTSAPKRLDIWISLSGEEEKVVRLLQDFDDRLAAMKPINAFVTRLDPVIAAMLVVSFPFFALLARILATRESLPSGERAPAGRMGSGLVIPPSCRNCHSDFRSRTLQSEALPHVCLCNWARGKAAQG